MLHSLLPHEERQLSPTTYKKLDSASNAVLWQKGKWSCGKQVLDWDLGKYKAIKANSSVLKAPIGLHGPYQPYLGPPTSYSVALMKVLPVPAWVCTEPSQNHPDTWCGLSAVRLDYTWIMESYMDILQDHYLNPYTCDNLLQPNEYFALQNWGDSSRTYNWNWTQTATNIQNNSTYKITPFLFLAVKLHIPERGVQ